MHIEKTPENKPLHHQTLQKKPAGKHHAAHAVGTGGVPHNLQAGIAQLRANTATAEAPVQAMRRENTPGQPWHVQQQKQAPALTADTQPIQRVTNEIRQPLLTNNMELTWENAYPKMQQITNASSFGTSPKHSVLLWAVSKSTFSAIGDSHGMTQLYVSKNEAYQGYAQDDYDDFDQVVPPYDFSKAPNHAYRVLIIINLTKNKSVEQLYTTFLHEWHVHALPWIRDAESKTNVKGDYETRIKGEHRDYANATDEKLEEYVGTLNLGSVSAGKVLGHLKKDRNSYDKVHGGL